MRQRTRESRLPGGFRGINPPPYESPARSLESRPPPPPPPLFPEEDRAYAVRATRIIARRNNAQRICGLIRGAELILIIAAASEIKVRACN
jgi:hypothetical protein